MSLMSDLLLGKTCTTRLRCLSLRLRLSCTLLARRRTWCLQGEIEVYERIGLRIFQEFGHLRAEPADLVDGQVVELPRKLGFALRERGLHDASTAPLFCLVDAQPVALRIGRTMQRCRADPGEGLLDGAPESLMGVARGADDA